MNISGAASKGLILGANVNAYLINDDGTKADTPIGTTTTDNADGSYKLELGSDYNDKAFIIEITAADGSQMKCDLSVCLAGDDAEAEITFGELYTLPDNFKLSAASSGSGDISINITPLTNIAAALTLDKVANGAKPTDATTAANAQVGNLLGLNSDVTKLSIVDLTDATAIKAASSEALNANLKAAAIVEAALKDSPAGTSLEGALTSFVSQYVNQSGVAQTEGAGVNTPSISLEEIAAAAQALTDKVTTLEGISAEDSNIASVKTSLQTQKDEAAAGSTQASQGDVPDDIGAEGLVATKAFVQQVSTFNMATDLDAANTFNTEIELATDLASSDLAASSEALSLAASAIAEAVSVNNEKPTSTYTYQGIITVAISTSGDTVTYTVEQPLDVRDDAGVATTTTVKLVAVVNEFSDTIVDTETGDWDNGTWSSKGDASINIALSGTVSTNSIKMAINDGSKVIAALSVDEEGRESQTTSWSEEDSGLLKVTGVDAALTVTIAQVASTEVTDPISFEGKLALAAELLSMQYNEKNQYESSQNGEDYTDQGSETISVDGLTASLSGKFSNSAKSLEASVALAVSGFKETCSWNNESSNTPATDFTSSHSYDCSLPDETADKYASASISVRFNFDVDGIKDDVALVADIERTGLESGVASIDLTYGGKLLDFDFNTNDIVEVVGVTDTTTTIKGTLTNHNGVILTVTNVEVDYETGSDKADTSVTTGVISVEGEQFATVSDNGIVTFSDGTFVSL